MATPPLETLPPPGEPMSAPLAPASGKIEEPAGSTVVVVVQRFWDSPTIRALRYLVGVSWGLFLTYTLGEVIAQKGDVTLVNWHSTLHVGANVAVLSLASGIFAWLKSHDNNPVK